MFSYAVLTPLLAKGNYVFNVHRPIHLTTVVDDSLCWLPQHSSSILSSLQFQRASSRPGSLPETARIIHFPTACLAAPVSCYSSTPLLHFCLALFLPAINHREATQVVSSICCDSNEPHLDQNRRLERLESSVFRSPILLPLFHVTTVLHFCVFAGAVSTYNQSP